MKGWRLFALGLATAMFNFLTAFDYTALSLDPKTIAIINGGIGLGVVLLRAFTNTAIGKKE